MTEKAKKQLKCGLIMPISQIDGCTEAHWDEVRIIIKEALTETEFSVELVSDSNEVGIIQKRIVQNIYDNEIVVCDVSAKNPNVMFELGMRLAFDKPTIIIKDDKTNYSFDTSPIEHLEYPRDLHYHTIQAFKAKLRDKVIATYEASKRPDYTTFLKHFGQFVVAQIEEKKVGKEDYLLQAVSELRDELRMMGKTAYQREYSVNRLAELALLNVKADRNLSEHQFLIDYLSKHKRPSLTELKDPESEAFKNILEAYLDEHVPPNIAMKGRHQETIKQRMLDALSKLT